MIKITIYQNDKSEYVGFRTKGHAGYDEYGKDIVCASASVLVINTINSIEAFTEDQISVRADEESGEICFRLQNSPSKEAALLLSAMVLGLQNMADEKEYRNYIDLRFREV
nr:ribosomal-processing cysteine protease Prp [uncultured Sellimonas sp.]